MESIAAYSRIPKFSVQLLSYLPHELGEKVNLHALPSRASLEEFLKYEIPELIILHIRFPEDDYREVLEKITKDPWLDSIAIVLVVDGISEELIEQYRPFNLAYILNEREAQTDLQRVIQIFSSSKNLLNHSELIKSLAPLSGQLVLGNEIIQVHYYSNFFSNFLYRKGYISSQKKFATQLALTELLQNAIEHGNAEISYAEKTEFLSNHKSLQSLITQRLAQEDKKGRQVILQYRISPLETEFTISDDGPGFDYQTLIKGGLPSLDSTHGRGLFLAKSAIDRMEYRGIGSEVNFVFLHDGSAERVIPPGFSSGEPINTSVGDVIFQENESSNSLYYIVSGEYTVVIGDKEITNLTAEDIFLGEMSFLLGNKRSASIVVSQAGKLVEISRNAFTDAIKAYPNYGIFLSKLLARRLKEANLRYVGNQW